MECSQAYIELYERCLKTSREICALAKEKPNARTALEGLLGLNDKQLAGLEDMSDKIIADENLQNEISKHYAFPLDTVPAIIFIRLQNLTNSYVRISLSTIGDDFKAYVQEKTEQTNPSVS
jgi:hypothetical protein